MRGDRDRRGLDPQDVGPERHALEAQALRGRDLVGREAPLGADGGDDFTRASADTIVERPAARVGDEPQGIGMAVGKRLERGRRCDLHERVAATLLAGLDHYPFEPRLRSISRTVMSRLPE